MAAFSYTALDPSGKKKTGIVEANDVNAAVAAVASQGRSVVEIKEAVRGSSQSKHASEEKKRPRATKADVALFTRRLADLSDAGLPLDRALKVLAEQSESQPLCDACEASLEDVKTGIPVSEALSRHPKLFPSIYTQTLAAGEASGQFAQSAERLADLQENEVARRSQIVSALIYPAVLLMTAVLVVVFLLTFVVPRLAGVFSDMGDALPLPTKMLLAFTDLLTQNGLLILGVIAVSIIGFRLWSATDTGKYARDSISIRLPIFGTIIMRATVSRYARVLGTLVYGGVGILDAIELAGQASGSQVFIEKNKTVLEEVRDGRGIADSMKDTGLFPPVLTHMAAIGEETGDLPKMLDRVADSLDFEVEQSLRRATALLEPIIVLAMGVFVAFVVLSVMLPIFQAQEMIK